MKNQLQSEIKSQYNADQYAVEFYEHVYGIMRHYEGKITLTGIRAYLKKFDPRIKVDKFVNGSQPAGTICIMSSDYSVKVYVGKSGQPFSQLTMEQLNEQRYLMLKTRLEELFRAYEDDNLAAAQKSFEDALMQLRSALAGLDRAAPQVLTFSGVMYNYLRNVHAITFPGCVRNDALRDMLTCSIRNESNILDSETQN